MTGRGPDLQSQLQHGITKSAQAISQLLQFSCHKRERMQVPRDTPFAVYVVIRLFATAYRNRCSHVNAKIPWAAKNVMFTPKMLSHRWLHPTLKDALGLMLYLTYHQDSLKAQTRQKMGSGARRKVVGNSRPREYWNNFLRCDDNKIISYLLFLRTE